MFSAEQARGRVHPYGVKMPVSVQSIPPFSLLLRHFGTQEMQLGGALATARQAGHRSFAPPGRIRQTAAQLPINMTQSDSHVEQFCWPPYVSVLDIGMPNDVQSKKKSANGVEGRCLRNHRGQAGMMAAAQEVLM